jgi:aminomethyltransferase
MMPFAGYDMPLQYSGIVAEHTHTRQHASLFDVSHMGQVVVEGAWETVVAFLEQHLPGDLRELAPQQMRYSLLLNEHGGVIDDLMVIRRPHDVLLVLNAARKRVDIAHLEAHAPTGVRLRYEPDWALLALQGPSASDALGALSTLPFMSGTEATVHGISCYVTRSGYTGEDGYEISLAAHQAEALATALCANEPVQPAGLGARDTLRLEAGLCLYGHELTEDISPLEAGLGWVIGKRRRVDGGFAGAARVMREIEQGAAFARIGLVGQERQPIRDGALLTLPQGGDAGIVTSASFAPTLGMPIAMARVAAAFAKEPEFTAQVREKTLLFRRFTMPFIKHRYYKG